MSGDDLYNAADVTDMDSGYLIAHFSRENVNLNTNQSNYHVNVAQTVDLSIMAGLCICLDERWDDERYQIPFFSWH